MPNPWKHLTIPFNNRGLDLIHPVDQVDIDHYSIFTNVKSVQEGTLQPRPGTSLINSIVLKVQDPVVTAADVKSHGDGSNNSTYTSGGGNITFEANRLYLVVVVGRNTSDAAIVSNTMSGGGMTWVKEQTIGFDTVSSPRSTLAVWRGMRTSGSQSDDLTWTWSATSDFGFMQCTEFQGMDTGGSEGSAAVIQDVTFQDQNTSTPSITMSAFGDPQNATFGCFANRRIDGAWTAGSGFTQLHDQSSGGALVTFTTQWKNTNDLSVDATHSGSTASTAGIGIEIKAP